MERMKSIYDAMEFYYINYLFPKTKNIRRFFDK